MRLRTLDHESVMFIWRFVRIHAWTNQDRHRRTEIRRVMEMVVMTELWEAHQHWFVKARQEKQTDYHVLASSKTVVRREISVFVGTFLNAKCKSPPACKFGDKVCSIAEHIQQLLDLWIFESFLLRLEQIHFYLSDGVKLWSPQWVFSRSKFSYEMRWDEKHWTAGDPRTVITWVQSLQYLHIARQSKLASGKHWPSSSLDQVTQLQSSLRSRTLSDRDIDDFRHCLQSGFFIERCLLMRGEEALLAELKTKQFVSVIWTC